MSIPSSSDRQWLADKFGPRANFDPTERMLYGHDIAAVPGLVKPLLGGTTPDAVVQPVSEDEVAALAKWASKKRIPSSRVEKELRATAASSRSGKGSSSISIG